MNPFLLIVAILGAALGSGCDRPPPLTVASHVWPGYELMFLARDAGWIDARRARLQESPSASASLARLRDGSADGAALTLDEVIRARAEGLDLVVVLVFNVSAGADVVLARDGVAGLDDIAGRRIGAETGALGALMLARLLQIAGVPRDSVEVVPVASDRHAAAWAEDDLDLLITFEPTASSLETEGARRLLDTRALPDTVIDVLAIRADALGRHRQGVREIIAAHFRALDRLRRNPLDAAYHMGRRLGHTGPRVLDLFGGLKLPGVGYNRELLAPGGALHARAGEIAAMLAEGGLLDGPPGLSGLTDPGYLPAKVRR